MPETDHQQDGYILIVEDDPDLRAVEEEVVLTAGYDVRIARDGIEALEVLETAGAPGLILLDLRMPRMNGWDLASELRQDARWRSIPIVVVAAHYAVGDEAEAIGARAWLHKPASIDELTEVVADVYRPPGGHSGSVSDSRLAFDGRTPA